MDSKYSFFTAKEVRVRGWMKKQLEIQAAGLAGNLDKVWPDVRNSKWIGGDREGWERVPYWLDGFIPLAYLLGKADMKKRAQKYIEKIIEGQEADGWICPNGDTPREKYDSWAVILISKVLTVYYECSGDARIPDVLYRTLKNYYDLLSQGKIKLFEWGRARWFEAFVALNKLAELYPNEGWMSDLANILKEQGLDYAACIERWKTPVFTWTFETHIVNIGMMLKYEAVSGGLLGKPYEDIAETLYSVLSQYNGTPAGIFNGDECLAGTSAIQGAELCSVVELMYSLEVLYCITGDKKWAERLEVAAFNALPATVSDDMWAHQYDQMSNQIDCTPFQMKPIFGTNGTEAHVFGLEPNYGCCTANFGQGWPKFALSAFMRAEDGVVSAIPFASGVEFEYNGLPVKVTLDTDYPFTTKFTYRVKVPARTDMKLYIRVPYFAQKLKVNGKEIPTVEMITVPGFDAGETVIKVDYKVIPKIEEGKRGLYHVTLGSLLFSLPIQYETKIVEYERNGVERKFPYCDYYYSGKSDWNYGFASKKLSVERAKVGDVPFSSQNPPISVTAKVSHIDWGVEPGYPTVCARTPEKTTALDQPREIKLIPYGCAKLRMTQMPFVSK